MKTETLLASVTYKCETEKGYSFKLTADLVDKFGLPYGNHHGVVVFENNADYYGIDVRYDKRFDSVEGFYENILDVLTGRYNIGYAKLIDKE